MDSKGSAFRSRSAAKNMSGAILLTTTEYWRLSVLKTVLDGAASCGYHLVAGLRNFRGSRPLLINGAMQKFQSNVGPIQERDK